MVFVEYFHLGISHRMVSQQITITESGIITLSALLAFCGNNSSVVSGLC